MVGVDWFVLCTVNNKSRWLTEKVVYSLDRLSSSMLAFAGLLSSQADGRKPWLLERFMNSLRNHRFERQVSVVQAFLAVS